jgi:hypothetical protein
MVEGQKMGFVREEMGSGKRKIIGIQREFFPFAGDRDQNEG